MWGHFCITMSCNEERKQSKTVNVCTLSCNLSVFTRVRLLVLWVLETVGVAGIVSGSSFTGRPAFAVNVNCKRQQVKLCVSEHTWLLLSSRIGKVFSWRGQRNLRTLNSMYYYTQLSYLWKNEIYHQTDVLIWRRTGLRCNGKETVKKRGVFGVFCLR